MNRETAARCLAELGNLTRLDIYRLLVRAGPDGLNSTLAFHLRGLVGSGLVAQKRMGRAVICRAQYRQMNAVIEFLREECCKGFEEEPRIAPRRAS